jgi:hypothetical protein
MMLSHQARNICFPVLLVEVPSSPRFYLLIFFLTLWLKYFFFFGLFHRFDWFLYHVVRDCNSAQLLQFLAIGKFSPYEWNTEYKSSWKLFGNALLPGVIRVKHGLEIKWECFVFLARLSIHIIPIKACRFLPVFSPFSINFLCPISL